MILVENEHLEVMTRAVTGIGAAASGNGDDLVLHNSEARTKRFIAPAEADHPVVLRPLEKGVVRRVINNQATAAADVSFVGLFGVARPASALWRMTAIEVVYDHIVAGKVGLLRVGADVDREAARTLKNGFDRASTGLPIVVVHAINDEDGKLVAGCRRLRESRRSRAQARQEQKQPKAGGGSHGFAFS